MFADVAALKTLGEEDDEEEEEEQRRRVLQWNKYTEARVAVFMRTLQEILRPAHCLAVSPSCLRLTLTLFFLVLTILHMRRPDPHHPPPQKKTLFHQVLHFSDR